MAAQSKATLNDYVQAVLSHDGTIARKPAERPEDLLVPVHHAMMDLFDNEDKDLSLAVARLIHGMNRQ